MMFPFLFLILVVFLFSLVSLAQGFLTWGQFCTLCPGGLGIWQSLEAFSVITTWGIQWLKARDAAELNILPCTRQPLATEIQSLHNVSRCYRCVHRGGKVQSLQHFLETLFLPNAMAVRNDKRYFHQSQKFLICYFPQCFVLYVTHIIWQLFQKIQKFGYVSMKKIVSRLNTM